MSRQQAVKSKALKQIGKQIGKLQQCTLQPISALLVVKPEWVTTRKQPVQFSGFGRLRERFVEGMPLLKEKTTIKDLNPSSAQYPLVVAGGNIREISPSKMPCGPGAGKNISREQQDILKGLQISPHGAASICEWYKFLTHLVFYH